MDARRGGLVILHDRLAADAAIHRLADEFAHTGYETLGLPVGSMAGLDLVIASLKPPVVLLAVGDAAALAWRAAGLGAGLAAVAIYLEAGAVAFEQDPVCPVILHLAHGAVSDGAGFAETLAEQYPDVRVHGYDAGPGFLFETSDASRLARLRTLQVFSQAGGARGEL